MPPKKRSSSSSVSDSKKSRGATTTSSSAAAAVDDNAETTSAVSTYTGSDPLKLTSLFQGGGERWMSLLAPVIEAQPNAASFIGPTRAETVVPLRELTFQALKPNAPENWNVIVFGQNPYPRVESATGVAMFDNTFSTWEDKRFGKVTSMRCIIKAACMWKFGVPKDTPVQEIRDLLKREKIVAPPEWFQAILTQGCLLLNAALTASTDDSVSTSKHTTFWRPVVRQIIEEILRAKSQSKGKSGVVFAWWGTHAQYLRRYVDELNAKYNVPVEHIDHSNPAAQGDMFCAGNHFKVLNEALSRLSLPNINFLPKVGWNDGATHAAADVERMGRFIADTRDLHKMYLERLQGVQDEKGEEIDEITGVRTRPLQSFSDSTKSLIGVVPAIEGYLQRSLKYAADKPSKNLTTDEVAALHLYTLESQFYRLINAALRDKKRNAAIPFHPYLRLFFHTVEKLLTQTKQQTLWRGVALDISSQYVEGELTTWWGVSSCTIKESVAQGFLGSSGKRTLFEIIPSNSVSISDFSAFVGEAEYILWPGTQLHVDSVERKTNGITHIKLRELPDSHLIK